MGDRLLSYLLRRFGGPARLEEEKLSDGCRLSAAKAPLPPAPNFGGLAASTYSFTADEAVDGSCMFKLGGSCYC